MDKRLLLLPVLALVLLTLVVWLRLGAKRIGEMRRKRLAPQVLSTRVQASETLTDAASASDNFNNLFELPVLFYTLVVLLYVTDLAERAQLCLAWTFVATRYVHSWIHLTYNKVMHRFVAFVAGALLLWAMWILFAARLIAAL